MREGLSVISFIGGSQWQRAGSCGIHHPRLAQPKSCHMSSWPIPFKGENSSEFSYKRKRNVKKKRQNLQNFNLQVLKHLAEGAPVELTSWLKIQFWTQLLNSPLTTAGLKAFPMQIHSRRKSVTSCCRKGQENSWLYENAWLLDAAARGTKQKHICRSLRQEKY